MPKEKPDALGRDFRQVLSGILSTVVEQSQALNQNRPDWVRYWPGGVLAIREAVAVFTMQQVADHAKVSISTVSFVVNDTKPVTPETRERVLRAIDELGYRRNSMARARRPRPL